LEKAKWTSQKLGTPVIPIRKDRKGPTIRRWPEQAASDPGEIETLFAGWPDDAMYGVVVGRGSGVFFFDTDSSRAEELFQSLGLPPSFTVRTGRGYHHYYATADGTVPKHTTDIQGIGLDLISNSQGIGPYSTRADGVTYLPEDPQSKVSVLAAEEVGRICTALGIKGQSRETTTTSWDPRNVAPDLESWKRVMDATYNAEADYNSSFGWERRGVSSADPDWEDEAREYLIEKVETEYGERIPGTTADRIMRIEPSGTAGQWTVAVPKAENVGGLELTEAERLSVLQIVFGPFPDPEAQPPGPAPQAAKKRDHFTLEELLERPELLKRGERTSPVFCREGELSLLAAREKAGKTTLAVWDLVEATKQGTPAMLVSYEEAWPRIVTRFKAMGAAPHLTHVVQMPTSLARIEELIVQNGVKAIVIDSGSSYVGTTKGKVPDTSQAEEWQRAYAEIQAVAIRHNVGICVLVHSPKNEAGGVRGSTGIAAAADTIFQMKPKGGNPRRRYLKVIGRWDNETRVFEANHDGEPTAFEEVDRLLAESVAVRLFTYLIANPGAGVREIRGAVPGKTTAVDATRKELVANGQVVCRTEGRTHSHYANDAWEPDLMGQRLVPKGTEVPGENL
jgi:hypothetical protein